MAKKDKEKKQKTNKKLEKAMRAFFSVSHTVGITDDMDKHTVISLLLNEGVKEMKAIADNTDSIVNEDYSEVSEMMNIPVSKQQYTEFVNIMSKIRMNAFTEKNREKYEETVKQKLFDQCLREKFLDNVINQYEEDVPVPDWNTNISINIASSDDKEFNEVLQRSVEKRIEVLNVHTDMLNRLGLAFEFATEMKYSRKDYKMLVDWKYLCGGVPNENSAPKLFSLFYNFNKVIRLATEFFGDAVEDLLFEMGLHIETDEPNPMGEHYPWWGKDMIDLYCPRTKDDYYDWLKEK